MAKLEREMPLPDDTQGRWVELTDPTAELIVNGGEITCYGGVVQYDYKEADDKSGALAVILKVSDPADEDVFQRANITGLAITPEGEFHVWNVKFAAQFVRPNS